MHPYLSQRHMPYSGIQYDRPWIALQCHVVHEHHPHGDRRWRLFNGWWCQSFDHDDVGVSCDESLSGEEGGQRLSKKPFPRTRSIARYGEFDVVHGCRWTGADRVVDRRTIEYQQVPPGAIDRSLRMIHYKLRHLPPIRQLPKTMLKSPRQPPPSQWLQELGTTCFWRAMFEVASALGTVGLTVNFTSLLSDLGRCVIIVLMFMGRLGPLSVFAAVSRTAKETKVLFAKEETLVG